MKRPELTELLGIDEFQKVLMWYYILREVGYTTEDFDKCADALMNENPMTRDVINATKPYIIEAMERIENEDRT